MITREEYLEHGLEKVEFDSERAFDFVDVDPGQDPLDALAPNAAYDYDADCEALAQAMAATVAPGITIEDMPAHPSAEVRQSVLDLMCQGLSEVDLCDISRRALALEVRDPVHYWSKAFDDCLPILQKQADQLEAKLPAEEAAGPISAITAAARYINHHMQEGNYTRGDDKSLEQFAAASLSPNFEYSREEKKVLLGHLIMHSRLGVRASRQFESAVRQLPSEAAPMADLVRDGGMEVELMEQVNYFSGLSREDFGKSLGGHQKACFNAIEASAEALSNGGEGSSATGLLHDRVRLRACGKMVDQSAGADPASPDFMEKHRRANLALLREFPLGSGRQVVILPAEIARMRIEAREATIENLLRPARRDDPQK